MSDITMISYKFLGHLTHIKNKQPFSQVPGSCTVLSLCSGQWPLCMSKNSGHIRKVVFGKRGSKINALMAVAAKDFCHVRCGGPTKRGTTGWTTMVWYSVPSLKRHSIERTPL